MFAKPLVAVTALAVSASAQISINTAQDAYVTEARGQVCVDRDHQTWAVSTGEHVAIQRVLTTGEDGYVRLELSGGSNFEIYSNSRAGFRQNAASAGDLLDLFQGRARIHFQPTASGSQQRIFTPTAIITAVQPATISLALDGNDTLRLDVLEGEVRVQHKLLPRSEPTIVKAVDAILVEPDEKISRQLDRGTLYRYAWKPLHDLFSVLTPGHKAEPVEQQFEEQFLARR